jgi:dTDP-4-amino-4,6-dideoxygalactose transaminase
MLKTKEYLASCNIFTRRYFYPSLNTLTFASGATCSISEDIASRVLALPLYFDLSINDVQLITNAIKLFN